MTGCWDGHRTLERIAYRAWPSEETVGYDGWVLRASDGYTKRANSVNPHFGSTLPLEEKISHCEAFYAERGLPSIFRLTPFSQPKALDCVLAAAGYATLDPTLVMTAPISVEPGAPSSSVRRAPESAWLDAFDRLQGLDPQQRLHHRRIVEAAEGERCFALVEESGDPIACGLGIVVDGVLGLFDLYTAVAHRRQGHGTAVVGALLDWAARAGAREGFLQVHCRNAPAQGIYARFGFRTAYPYWYRIAPPASPG